MTAQVLGTLPPHGGPGCNLGPLASLGSCGHLGRKTTDEDLLLYHSAIEINISLKKIQCTFTEC